MVRQVLLTCEDVWLFRQRRADAGVGRFRWDGAEELRLSTRMNLLFEIVSKAKKLSLTQEPAVHPQTGWFTLRRETRHMQSAFG